MEKLCVKLIVPYRICRKGKELLILKVVNKIDPVTGWFKVTKYNENKVTKAVNLVDTTWLSRYHWPSEITYDCRRESLGHEFKNIWIEYKYGILTKPEIVVNPQVNSIIERIHWVLHNLVSTFELDKSYVYGDDTWKGIVVIEAFSVRSTFHTTTTKITIPTSVWEIYNLQQLRS